MLANRQASESLLLPVASQAPHFFHTRAKMMIWSLALFVCWKGTELGSMSMKSTRHCPHTRRRKRRGCSRAVFARPSALSFLQARIARTAVGSSEERRRGEEECQ